MRRAARVDANHRDITRLLRDIGCSVESLHRVGGGVPDLLVGFQRRNLLLEVKTEKGKIDDDQLIWHRGWAGQVAVVRSLDDCLRELGL